MGDTKLGLGADKTVQDLASSREDVDLARSETLHRADPRASAPLVGSGTAPVGEPARGDSVGRFVVLGVLGSGGMGLVYSGYDPHLDRKVAIKLLNADTVRSGDATTRLLREAQALAKINHPNVIKVHEVGTYGEQVYLAMEFADGGTLRSWLEQERRDRGLILDAFIRAGRGLAAAHAAGLVHRDFKPDNVLLTKAGGVLVTDFGLVGVVDAPAQDASGDGSGATSAAISASGPRPTEAVLAAADIQLSSTPLSQNLTRTGSIMGTPAYMAPEQFSGAGNASAAADQFSFCTALYEALYRARPFRGESMQELATNVLLGQVLPPPAGSDVPKWLRRVLVRGLATAPAKRYPSMAALLSELEREPVRRRRRAIAIAGIAGTALVGTFVVLGVRSAGGPQCRASDDRLERVWNAERRTQIRAAFDATKRADAAAQFGKLVETLDGWSRAWSAEYLDACEDTHVRGDQSDRLLDLRMQCLSRKLDDAAATIALFTQPGAIDRSLEAARALPTVASCSDPSALEAAVAPPETPDVRERVQGVRATLDDARGQWRLGRYQDAAKLAGDALVAARSSGYRPVEGEALLVVGLVESELGRAASIAYLREAMHAAAASGDTTTMVDAAGHMIAAMAARSERPDVALEIAGLVETTAQHAHVPTESLARLYTSIGSVHENRGKPDDARQRFEQALQIAEPVLGPEHPQVLASLTQLGNLATLQGRFDDALKQLERVRATAERVFGASHPKVAAALSNLGLATARAGKLAVGKQLYERALAMQLATVGAEHPGTVLAHLNLGNHHIEQAEYDAARTHLDEALRVSTKLYGAEHAETARVIGELADLSLAKLDLEAARTGYERAIATFEAVYGPDHPSTSLSLGNLGVTLQKQGKLDEAHAIFARVQRVIEKVYGPHHPDIVDAMANMSSLLRAQNKPVEAEAMSTRLLPIAEQVYGAEHPRVGMVLVNLGNLQYGRDAHEVALASYQRSLAIFEAKFGKDHPNLSYSLLGVGGALAHIKGRGAEAVPYLERALAIRTAAKLPPAYLAPVIYSLAKALSESPSTRPRAIAEIDKAIAMYVADKDETNLVEARKLRAEIVAAK